MDRLIYSENPEPVTGEEHMRRKTWRSKMPFRSFPQKETSRTTVRKNAYRLSAEEVSQWAQSLDNLLNSKYGLTAFRLFMKSEHCEEIIEFWMACEKFQKIKSRSKLRSKAKRIYEKFIREGSPKEVNLDYRTKETVDQCLMLPTQTSFIAAQNKAYHLMEHNSYPRFLESELYCRLCELAKRE
ncbi:regulator of G-protein signaling 2 [Paramisgurnus dabryanus]|uniref:regulator of G-protein signaling 2 n=1 Tax=Paramisgurnus dabryanus TaxID=90735 RepID=UPI0031F34C5F